MFHINALPGDLMEAVSDDEDELPIPPMEPPPEIIVPPAANNLGLVLNAIAQQPIEEALEDVAANNVVLRQLVQLPPSSPRARKAKRDKLEWFLRREVSRRKRVETQAKLNRAREQNRRRNPRFSDEEEEE